MTPTEVTANTFITEQEDPQATPSYTITADMAGKIKFDPKELEEISRQTAHLTRAEIEESEELFYRLVWGDVPRPRR